MSVVIQGWSGETFRCPYCGTGRWHTVACPLGAPGEMYDEALRQERRAEGDRGAT